MKFIYTNSNNEEACYEATLLTPEIYENLLQQDTLFLNLVSAGQLEEYKDSKFTEAASSMLISFGKGREKSAPVETQNNVIVLVNKKTTLKKGDNMKLSSDTPKKILRNVLATSKIRAFKKEKMSEIQDLAN